MPWNLQKINDGGVSSGPGAVGDTGHESFVCVYGGQQHFAYLDANGNIQDAWYDATGGWHSQQINNANGHGPAVAGEYVASPAATAPAVGDLFVCVYNGQQHFAYRDANGNIQDVWFDGSNWHSQQINNANGHGPAVAGEYVASSAAPAAGEGNLFVCVYDDGQHPTGQHFAYRGAGPGSGDVWDCWWSAPTPSDLTVTPTSIIYKHSLDLGADIGNIAGPISLTITSDGSYNFSGQLNNSGKAPYTVNVAVGIESVKGSLFLFTASQSINGNDLFDNNNAGWNTTGNNATIKGVWGDLQAHTTANYQSSNSVDLAAIVSSLESAFQDVQNVITVAAAL